MRLQHSKQTHAIQYEPAGCEAYKFIARDLIEKGWPTDLKFKASHLPGEEKFDGVRYQIQCRPNGAKHNYLTGRRVSDVTGLYTEKQNSLPFIRDYKFPWKHTVFDAEFVGEGISSDIVSSIAKGYARCVVFDLTFFEGDDLRPATNWVTRNEMLTDLSRHFPVWMTLSKLYYAPLKVLPSIIARGGEGMVLKEQSALYGRGWWKVIQKEYHDCVITGFTMATEKKYAEHGWIKNILIGQYVPTDRVPKAAKVLRTICHKGRNYALIDVGAVSSGMDETQRAEFTRLQKVMLGEPIEVSCKQRLPTGMFRSPVFERLRPDKHPTQCSYV